MSLDPGHMVDRLRSYAQAIADDQHVTVSRVLNSMQAALTDLTHSIRCVYCSVSADDDAAHDQLPPAVVVRVDPQDVTNA